MRLVRHPEGQHGAAVRDRLDGMLERRRLVADRLDHDVRPRVVAERRGPLRAGAPLHRVDAERVRGVAPVDRVDARHVPGARRLQDVREQHPDRPLPDHRDPRAAHVAEPAHRVQHRAQRLDHGGLNGRELVVERADLVGTRNELLRQPEMPLGPPDHARADRQVVRRARLHLADQLVQRVARLAVRGADQQVADAEEARKVAAADPAGLEAHHHPPGAWLTRLVDLDRLQLPRRDSACAPTISPPAWRRRRRRGRGGPRRRPVRRRRRARRSRRRSHRARAACSPGSRGSRSACCRRRAAPC